MAKKHAKDFKSWYLHDLWISPQTTGVGLQLRPQKTEIYILESYHILYSKLYVMHL